MNDTPLPTRAATRYRPTALVALLAILLSLVATRPALAADAGAESEFVALLNRERTSRGLAPLSVASDLVSVARGHSARMADEISLYHNPDLAGSVSGWRKLGENVGRGPRVASIHDAFMASPGHRANVLGTDWLEVGVGVEVRDGTVWVTQVFRLPDHAEPEPEPEPEPAPAPVRPARDTAPAPAPAPQPTATTTATTAAPAASAPAPAATTAATAPIRPATPPLVIPALTVCAQGDIPPTGLNCPE